MQGGVYPRGVDRAERCAMTINVQGWRVIRQDADAVYLRLPVELQRPIDGGCKCKHCRDFPDRVPSWDTLGVPLKNVGQIPWAQTTWTLHAPEWN